MPGATRHLQPDVNRSYRGASADVACLISTGGKGKVHDEMGIQLSRSLERTTKYPFRLMISSAVVSGNVLSLLLG